MQGEVGRKGMTRGTEGRLIVGVMRAAGAVMRGNEREGTGREHIAKIYSCGNEGNG